MNDVLKLHSHSTFYFISIFSSFLSVWALGCVIWLRQNPISIFQYQIRFRRKRRKRRFGIWLIRTTFGVTVLKCSSVCKDQFRKKKEYQFLWSSVSSGLWKSDWKVPTSNLDRFVDWNVSRQHGGIDVCHDKAWRRSERSLRWNHSTFWGSRPFVVRPQVKSGLQRTCSWTLFTIGVLRIQWLLETGSMLVQDHCIAIKILLDPSQIF